MRVFGMNLRKTVGGHGGRVFRIFEASPGVFYVLNAEGRTVDQFEVIETVGSKGKMNCAFRKGPLRPGAPDLAIRFVSELNAARLRH